MPWSLTADLTCVYRKISISSLQAAENLVVTAEAAFFSFDLDAYHVEEHIALPLWRNLGHPDVLLWEQEFCHVGRRGC